MDSTWFRRFTTSDGHGPRLVCFPHAGGSATAYLPLAKALPAPLDVVAVQYPGRQDRYSEEPFTSLAGLVDAVAGRLAPELAAEPERPYALFGHSMGALVAFETARLLVERGLPEPRRLFLSGRRAPGPGPEPYGRGYDDAAVLADVRRLGGMDPSMLDDPEVLEMVLPALRADYQALATYRWRKSAPLDIPITALIGDRDPMVTAVEACAWRERSRGDFALEVFGGGHFYLTEHVERIAATVAEQVAGAAVLTA
ncbi:thioesterase II family protein [Streptomyces sp. NPDC102406]|uniref:thioesterase II family protein n=1 Tax=Streptomyces sp. NPDC102406 TaxID=3366171 RepID=UPI0037F13308